MSPEHQPLNAGNDPRRRRRLSLVRRLAASPLAVWYGSVAVVAVCGVWVTQIPGYPPLLSGLLMFASWSIVASIGGARLADQSPGLCGAIIFLEVLAGYAGPSLLAVALLRRARPAIRNASVIAIAAAYLALLFVLFPMTDGP